MKIELFNLMFKFEKHRMEHIKKLISSISVRLFYTFQTYYKNGV